MIKGIKVPLTQFKFTSVTKPTPNKKVALGALAGATVGATVGTVALTSDSKKSAAKKLLKVAGLTAALVGAFVLGKKVGVVKANNLHKLVEKLKSGKIIKDFKGVNAAFGTGLGAKVSGAFKKVVSKVGKFAKTVISKVAPFVQNMKDSVKAFFLALTGKVPEKFVTVIAKAKENLKPIMENITKYASKVFKK